MITIMSEAMINCVQTCLSLPGRERLVKRNERLFYQGDKVRQLFVVLSGEVVLTRTTCEGDELVLQRTHSNQIAAEASLISQEYHCDAYANQQTLVYAVAKNDVQIQMNQDNNFALSWVAMLSKELKACRSQASVLRLKSVRKRLDAWLLMNGNILPLKGDRIEVAREIGVTPEALYRELAKRN